MMQRIGAPGPAAPSVAITARPAARWMARGLDLAGLVLTVAATAACALAALRLHGWAEGYFAAGGGSTFLAYLRHVDGADAARAALPGLHLRLMWYGLAWACAVFACGFGCLALAGARSALWRVQAVLRSA